MSSQFRHIFRALRFRNYRLFFFSNAVSLLGVFIQQVALGWFLYRLTGSKLLLGIVGFLQQSPGLLLTPIAGALSDRWDCRRALIGVQLGLSLQTALLAIALSTSLATTPVLLVLSGLQGVLNAFDLPIRQSMVPDLVDEPSALPSAIALNSAMFNLSRMVGPAIGGALVALLGEANCILINALSYVPVLCALCIMTPFRPKPRQPSLPTILEDILEGLHYAKKQRPFPDLLLLLAAFGMFGFSYVVLFPVIARDMLDGSPRTLGLLFVAAGAGSLLAAIRLATRRNLRGLLGSIGNCAIVASLALVAFRLVSSVPLAVCLIAAAGFGFISVSSASNTILQTLVEDRLRGRVLSLYSLAFVGMIPFGNLVIGALAERFGAQNAISLFGVLLLVCAIAFYVRLDRLRAAARPIYVERGLIPWQN